MKHDIFCIVVGILIALTGGGGYLLGRNCAMQSAEQAKSQAQKNSGCDTVLGTYC